VATQDVRLELIQHEYDGIRNAVHSLMDRMDGYEAAVLGLTEAVSLNSERLDRVEQRLDRVEQRLDSIESKLDRLMTHLNVPPKPPAGFVKE
jgi:chromosome segregation ATPase